MWESYLLGFLVVFTATCVAYMLMLNQQVQTLKADEAKAMVDELRQLAHDAVAYAEELAEDHKKHQSQVDSLAKQSMASSYIEMQRPGKFTEEQKYSAIISILARVNGPGATKGKRV